MEIKANLCRNAMNLKVDETNERNSFVWKEKEERKVGEVDDANVLL